MKAATYTRFCQKTVLVISIHAAREGGDIYAEEIIRKIEISIHAAREGGDIIFAVCRTVYNYFNPRRP